MKYLFTLLFVIVLFVYEMNSYDGWQLIGEIPVGKRPTSVYSTGQGMFYILCAGWDANNNGIKDAEDESPSIWYFWTENMIISSIYPPWAFFEMPQKLIDLEFEDVKLPYRALFDEDKEIFYISTSKGVEKISIEYIEYYPYKLSATSEVLLDLKPKSISGHKTQSGLSKLYLSMQDLEHNTGNVLIYDLGSNSFYDTIPAYSNVQMTTTSNYNTELCILNSDESSDSSRLQIVHIAGNIGSGKHLILKDIEIPTNANHIISTPNVYITSFKNSNITRVNSNYSITTFPVELPDGNGPREVFVSPWYGNHYWISSYNGFIYYINIENGYKLDSLKAYGKAESGFIAPMYMAIATPYHENSFIPDTAITLYGIEPVSVQETDDLGTIIISPNPASEYITVSSPFINPTVNRGVDESSEIKIFNTLGECVNHLTPTLSEGEGVGIDISLLPVGLYIIKIGNYSEKFMVVR